MEGTPKINSSADVVDTTQGQMKSKAKKTINIRSTVLKQAVRALSGIAKNALNQEDRLINFMVTDNVLFLTATDSAREAQIAIDVTSSLTEVFSTNVEKLMAVLADDGLTRIIVEEGYLLLEKDNDVIQLPKYKVNHKPYETGYVADVMESTKFVKILRTYSKYITNEADETGVIIFSDNHVYARNRLFYVITEFEAKETYIFDKTTCRNIITFCSAYAEDSKGIRLSPIKEESKILIMIGNASIKVPMLRHDKVNLSKFISMTSVNGSTVDRAELLRVIKEIREVEGTSEIDIIGRGNQVVIKPSTELSLTEYNLKAQEMEIEKGVPTSFQYTVNSNAFETLIKGVDTNRTMICSTRNNVMLVLNQDINTLIRFFISVF